VGNIASSSIRSRTIRYAPFRHLPGWNSWIWPGQKSEEVIQAKTSNPFNL